jgi:hypothetical protein
VSTVSDLEVSDRCILGRLSHTVPKRKHNANAKVGPQCPLVLSRGLAIVVENWSEVRKGELEVACGAWVAQALKVWEPAAHLDIGDVCERASRQYQMPFFADEA